MMESEVRTCRTRKATKAELKAAEQDAEKDLWRTYHRHLGEKGKKKGMSKVKTLGEWAGCLNSSVALSLEELAASSFAPCSSVAGCSMRTMICGKI